MIFSFISSEDVTDSPKKLHVPAKDKTEDPSFNNLTLYHVALKGLFSKAVQVYDIPNLYPVTFSPLHTEFVLEISKVQESLEMRLKEF